MPGVGREKLFRDRGITIPDDLAACCAGVTRGAVDILSNRVDLFLSLLATDLGRPNRSRLAGV